MINANDIREDLICGKIKFISSALVDIIFSSLIVYMDATGTSEYVNIL